MNSEKDHLDQHVCDDEIDLVQLVQILLKRKWMIINSNGAFCCLCSCNNDVDAKSLWGINFY